MVIFKVISAAHHQFFSRADVSNDRSNGIHDARGHAMSYTNGRTYVTSNINNYGNGRGEECELEGPFALRLAPQQLIISDPTEHVSRDVLSLVNWSMQIEGDATNDAQYDLDFFIPNSSVSIGGASPANKEFSSEVHAEIKLNNVVIWSFGYKLSTDGAAPALLEQTRGMGIVPDITCFSNSSYRDCFTSFFSNVLDLGIISAGSTALLEYEAWVETKAGAYTDNENCDGFFEEEFGCLLEVPAQFGDPSSISARLPVLTSTPVIASVPKSGIIGLFGLGLAGLFIRRRRK